ncbi:glycoside hydrolase family 16 protein [Schizophyllum commune]
MRSATTFVGLLAAAGSVSASHGAQRMRRHHRSAAKRDAVSGTAYYGYQNDRTTACGTVSSDDDFVAGVHAAYYGDIWSASDKCFQHITVYYGDKSIDVTLTDAANTTASTGDGDIYLSTAAFTALAGSLDVGMIDVTWEWASGAASVADAPTTQDAATTSSESAPTTSSSPAPPATTDAAPTTTDAPTTAPASTSTSAPVTSSSAPSGSSNEGWKVYQSLTGDTLINYFGFDEGQSDNSGVANYVNGKNTGLVYTGNDGKVYINVDTTQNVGLRNSVRMTSAEKFNPSTASLFIFDVEKVPAVCGVWPAIWFTGSGTWPYSGEVDVIEGVNQYTQNIVSIHTGPGCTFADSAVSSLTKAALVSGAGLNCDATVDTMGCGFSMYDTASYGTGFNAVGGGAYAVQMSEDGISVWFWQRDQIPADVTSGGPNPSSWGASVVTYSSASCDMSSHFQDLMLIITNNLGGTFPEGVWHTAGSGGQAQSCADITGFDSAANFVQNSGASFADAQFIINSFMIYRY